MRVKSRKESIILIIKQEGDCIRVPCSYCPFFDEELCVNSDEDTYKVAIDYYIKKYGKEELLEILI